MSDLLAIGASGVKAYGRALSVVGDNIANAQTPGYVRRDVRLEEAPSGGDIVLSRNSVRPGGVLAVGVDRAVDQWLADDARTAGGDAARQSARLGGLSAAESALEDGAIGDQITAIFTSADRLAADPGNPTLRRQLLAAVDQSASAFRRTAASLSSAAAGIGGDAQITASQLNTDLAALARINDGLRRARPGSTNEATLLDERDRLIGAVSSNIDVTASYDSTGAVTLRTSGGDALVDGLNVATISVDMAANGLLGFTVSTGGVFVPGSGKLAGLADAAMHIASQQNQLDTIAAQLHDDLNAIHQSGIDANGNPGGALLAFNGGAAAIAAIALTPDQVAAASAASGNGNMLAFGGLRGPIGLEANMAAMVAAQAQATAAARAQEAAASTRRDGAFAARDALSAVDLDREAAELLRFQQAYEAAARTIQVARETMQSILNIF